MQQATVASASRTETGKRKLHFTRFFTKEGVHPYDEITWEKRLAEIKDETGKSIFRQEDVEVPSFWSMNATNIVAQKYFRGEEGHPDRERSAKQIVDRVAKTITEFGRKGNYFASEQDAQIFEDEMTYILINQYAAFNSPVWFNVGITEKPQCSACFIIGIEDTLDAILEHTKVEGIIFKNGSGAGVNVSNLRSSKETLGGSINKSSGPISFMKGWDTFAGAIKSGGKTRRAAKMVIMNDSHPDIVEFIDAKADEEKKAWALIEAGYDGSFNGVAYSSVQFQNANHSVRVSDDFMRAVENDGMWQTRFVRNGEVAETFRARDIMDKIAEAAWVCGDPGLQYDTTLNRWHTSSNTGRINGSNPCSEFVFLDDTACNLASMNLMKYRNANGDFDVESFRAAVKVIIAGQEFVVDFSSYPTEKITENSHRFRPLGIGYANLGALLMARGLPYDSDEGRNYAAAITAVLSGEAYRVSAEIAHDVGPFAGYLENETPFLNVMNMHREAARNMDEKGLPRYLKDAAIKLWDEVVETGKKWGFKNAQISLLAPTGTIGFLMDCDTTGVEPGIALVQYKWLAGEGMIKIVNQTVPEALKVLGYSPEKIDAIIAYIDKNDTIEGSPDLKDEHLPVFDCAFRPANGKRSIAAMGHVRMMGAVQPFLSGAISKTVNMDNDVTPEDIKDIYMQAWKLGVKCIAIYRDGCKRTQPVTTTLEDKGKTAGRAAADARLTGITGKDREEVDVVTRPMRKRLPDERQAITHKFSIAGHEGYLTVGLYEDGNPGEVFIVMSKQGSTLSGVMDAFATAISVGLQYGVPLKALVKKFAHMRFEPAGLTQNKDIRIAKSLIDYVFRWLGLKFLSASECQELGIAPNAPIKPEDAALTATPAPTATAASASGADTKIATTLATATATTKATKQVGDPNIIIETEVHTKRLVPFAIEAQSDAPPCGTCGAIMIRSGACYKCLNCGSVAGCS